jgi:hypothetical protein
MNTTKKCTDCLHCKVSAKSTDNCRLCFCSLAEVRENRHETYWLTKPVCRKFDDMTDNVTAMIIIPAVALKRRPLLRERY